MIYVIYEQVDGVAVPTKLTTDRDAFIAYCKVNSILPEETSEFPDFAEQKISETESYGDRLKKLAENISFGWKVIEKDAKVEFSAVSYNNTNKEYCESYVNSLTAPICKDGSECSFEGMIYENDLDKAKQVYEKLKNDVLSAWGKN